MFVTKKAFCRLVGRRYANYADMRPDLVELRFTYLAELSRDLDERDLFMMARSSGVIEELPDGSLVVTG